MAMGQSGGPGRPGRPEGVEADRAASSSETTSLSRSTPRSTSTRWETYHNGVGPGHSDPSLTASLSVQTTRSNCDALVASADALKPVQQPTGDVPAPVSTETSAASNASDKQLQLSDDLVTRAQQT